MDKNPQCKSASLYEEIRGGLHSLDVIGFSVPSGRANMFERAIQLATNSLYTHVGFVLKLGVDSLFLVEAVSSGVRTVDLRTRTRLANQAGHGVFVRHVREGSQLGDTANASLEFWVRRQRGTPYEQDWIELAKASELGALLFGENTRSSKTVFCSELAVQAMQQVALFPGSFVASRYSPVEVMEGEEFSPWYMDPGDVEQIL